MAEPITLPTTRRTPLEPPRELDAIAAERPLTRLSFPDGELGWLATSHATGRAVLADPRFSARRELRRSVISTRRPVNRPAEPGMFIGHDAPEHTRYRKLLTGQFTVRRMRQLTPRIEQIVQEHMDAMAAAGPPVDLVSSYAMPIPSKVICELLGVPYGDRERFQRNTKVMISVKASQEQAERAVEDIKDQLRALVLHKRAEPTDDVLGGLMTTDLTDDELTNVGFLLLVAGHETTANMLGLGTLALLTHRDQLDALLADPDGIDNAVEELVRYLSIIQFGTTRAALEDLELDGELMRKGETVVISITQANRDPGRFDEPQNLDVHRATSGHLAFGHGIHQCLGQQLARMEMRAGYLELFRRFPGLRLAVPADQVVAHDGAILGLRELPVTW